MNILTSKLAELRHLTEAITTDVVAPMSGQVDRECSWPAHSMKAFAEGGLLGLQVPTSFGGHGEGLLALCILTETIAKACPSSALCFGMHCVGTAVIAAKATEHQQQDYLKRIALGQHITTLALSESGNGAHFYLPATELKRADGKLIVNGTKQFVTNGGYADSYVISVMAAGDQNDLGDFSCLIVDGDADGLEWLEPWHGFGMRGNSSRAVHFNNVSTRTENLLGEVGDQVWYVFEIVAPYFLMAMAGTYLGIAQSALDIAIQHARSRIHDHSERSLAEHDLVQAKIASMWSNVQKTRALIYEAARLGDLGNPSALPFILSCKADAGDTAVSVTNDAMSLCGGIAYRENSRLSQMLRDARASHVMSPTTDLLRLWTGRSLMNLPLL